MKYEWHTQSHWSDLDPIVQVHGVCFDESGKILIIREPDKDWHLVGGKPEGEESYLQTLRREVLEETNIEIGKAEMIGYQKVTRDDYSVIYQLRFAALIKSVGPEQPDPTTGLTNERQFVSPEIIAQYITYNGITPIVHEALRWLRANK